jgi:hypothetical protein
MLMQAFPRRIIAGCSNGQIYLHHMHISKASARHTKQVVADVFVPERLSVLLIAQTDK